MEGIQRRPSESGKNYINLLCVPTDLILPNQQMKMKLKTILLSCLLVFVSAIAKANTDPSDADETSKKNEINGGVFHNETKKPLTNVSVTAYLTANKKEKVILSDNNGNYAFDDLKPGTYKFVFEKNGYKKVTREKIIIKTDEGFQLNVEMSEEKDFDFVPGAFHF